MARRHQGLIVGIKTAHYAGPEWTPVERAVEAGTLADVPVMVDFGANRPERPMGELVTKKLRPGDIYTHVYSGLRGEQDRSGHVNPALLEGRKRGVIFDVGHGGGSFLWRDRGAGDEGGIPARFDLDRPAHQQHERRDEGHAQRDGQVPGDGHVARRGDCAIDVEPGAGDQAGGAGPPIGRAPWRTSPCCASSAGSSGFVDMNGARLDGTERLVCELTLQRRQDRVRPERARQAGLANAAVRLQ